MQGLLSILNREKSTQGYSLFKPLFLFNYIQILKAMKLLSTCLFLLIVQAEANGQTKELIPDLSKANALVTWQEYNRGVNFDSLVYMDRKLGDGVLWYKNFNFGNGKIELDIKGKNEQGRSFVGFAFHGQNDSTYDAVYFRPFNFLNPTNNNHSVQYISHPVNTWSKLRQASPGKYENVINPFPDPNGWFHATILVEYPLVKVFVNNSKEPSLTITQLSKFKEGTIGFWVGNNSEGFFKNLKITNN